MTKTATELYVLTIGYGSRFESELSSSWLGERNPIGHIIHGVHKMID